MTAAILTFAGCGDDRMRVELTSDLYANPVRAVVARTVESESAGEGEDAPSTQDAGRVFAVGEIDGDERYVFGKIGDVAVSTTGDTVYVTDRMSRDVRAFSSRGEFLFRFGGRGRGPGEYEDPVSITLVPWNGGVAVWDAVLQRVTVLSPVGEVLHTTLPLRQSDIAQQGKKLRAARNGFLLEVRSDPFTVAIERQRGFLVRLDTTGAVRDTLLDFAIPYIHGSTVQRERKLVSATQMYAPHWTPNPSWDAAPAGAPALAPGGKYEVFRIGGRDTAALRVTRPWSPSRVTRRERLAQIRYAKEQGLIAGPVPIPILEIAGRKNFAVTRPGVTGVLVDERGRAWVRRFDTSDHPEGLSRTWDGYAADGSPAGTVRFAKGFLPLVARGGAVYGVRRDGLDVDRLEAYRP